MNKNYAIHMLWAGIVACVSPVVSFYYAAGKMMDAYAAGSTANINMNRGHFDYLLIPLGLVAIIVSLVLHLKELRASSKGGI
jgi:hypothetical protein